MKKRITKEKRMENLLGENSVRKIEISLFVVVVRHSENTTGEK